MADNFIVTDALISADELNSLDNQYSGTVDATAVTTITGTAAEITTVYSSSGISGLGNEAITITDNHTLAQLKTINNATSGTITLNDYSVALNGSTADLKAALAGSFASTYTGNLVLNDANGTNIAAADISTIAGATTGTLTVSNNINITGTSEAIATAVGNVDTFAGTPTATLGDVHTLAQLKTINNAISGTITLNDVTVALSGSSADVAAALAGSFTSSYTGTVTITNADYTVAQLKAINNATTGAITLSTTNTALTGTAADLVLAFAGTVTEHTGTVTITDTPTDAQLALIDAATTGTISYSEGGGGSGGGNDYTVSDTTISADELNSLDNQYSGTVDATAVTTITGTAAEITTVYSSSGISGLGNEAITITDNHTLAQLKTINNATSGTITLNDVTVALSGSSADVAAALAGSFTSSYTGTVTITNADYTVAQLKAINNATTGAITLSTTNTALTGTAADLVLAFAGTVTEHTGTVTITDTPTDAQLALIDAATTGTISYSEGGGGSGGGNDYTVSDTTISASELNSLDNQYSGTVDATAVTTITGTAAEITTVYSSSGISGLGNEAITITDNHTLAQLKTINNATSGTITLNDLTVALSGSSADVAAALAGSFTSSYTGIVTITNADYTVAQLKAINNATTGVILLDAAATALSGSASDLVLAFAGTVTEHTGTVTITNADYTVAQLKAINNATTGAITLSTTNTALTGTAADLVLSPEQ